MSTDYPGITREEAERQMAIRMLDFVMGAISMSIGSALVAGQTVNACSISLRVAAGRPVGGIVHRPAQDDVTHSSAALLVGA